MLEFNGHKFAKGKNGLVETLFKAGSTASGYYSIRKRRIDIFAPNGEHIAVIANGVLGAVSILPCGKKWFSYANPKIIGEYAHENLGNYDLEVKTAMALMAGQS